MILHHLKNNFHIREDLDFGGAHLYHQCSGTYPFDNRANLWTSSRLGTRFICTVCLATTEETPEQIETLLTIYKMIE